MLFTYTLRSILARRATTLATVLGVAALVFTISGALMLIGGVQKALEEKGRPEVAVIIARGATSETESNFGGEWANTIVGESTGKAHDVVQELASVLDLTSRDGLKVTTQIRGVDTGFEKIRPHLKIIEGRALVPGVAEVMVGKRLLARTKGTNIGDEIEFRRGQTAKVVGVFADDDSYTESELWVDRDFLAAAFSRQGFVSSIRMRFDSAAEERAFAARLDADPRIAVTTYSEPEYLKLQGNIATGLISALGIAISLLIALGASLGVSMTMFGTVAQRRREIGVLRALGYGRFTILSAFVGESILFGVAAGIVGSIASSFLGSATFNMIGSGAGEIAFTFDVSLVPMLIASTFALVVCAVSGFLPAFRAASVLPTAAMRG